MGVEIELTMKVAVLAAGDMPRRQIATVLGCEDGEVRSAMVRLRRVMKNG